MSFTFKHPKYYTGLRKRNRDLSELQQVKLERSVPQSDQAISTSGSTECSDKRAPDPGQPGSGNKPQAASAKQQAPGTKLQKKI